MKNQIIVKEIKVSTLKLDAEDFISFTDIVDPEQKF